MSGLRNSVLWRSLSEGLYVFQDPALLRGKKNVLIMLAQDRAHPLYQEAVAIYGKLSDDLLLGDVEIRFEDHQGGLLHEKFQCDGDAFHCYFISKAGDLTDCGMNVPDPDRIFALIGRTRTSALRDAGGL